MESRRFRIGEFEFDAGTGELWRRNSDSGEEAQRLSPQPARLLALLASRGGDVLTREEIRGEIWPDVSVEFDSSLHFCIRQIRAALGDSAGDPRYIATLPRRGYRLMMPAEPLETGVEAAPGQAGRRHWSGIAALLIVVAVAVVVVLGGFTSTRQEEPPLRIAVMSFRPPADAVAFGDSAPIAEWILEDLALAAGDRAAVVGPTTTSDYDDSSTSLHRLAQDYELHYIVNGRFLNGADGPRMLAELIRVSDGAHVWVRSYEQLDDGQRIGLEISDNVLRELELERSQ